jgi:hypothetical protein
VQVVTVSDRADARQVLAGYGWVVSRDTMPELDICAAHPERPVVRASTETLSRGTMSVRMTCDNPSPCDGQFEQRTVRVATLRSRALRSGWQEYNRSRSYARYMLHHCCPDCAVPDRCVQCPPWDRVSDLIGHDPKGHQVTGALLIWFRRHVEVEDLAGLTEADLLDVRNLGVGAVARIRCALESEGLSLSV